VPEETSAALLSHASAAVLDALTLELMFEHPGPPAEPQHELDVRLAA
jgi:hypothetical protein